MTVVGGAVPSAAEVAALLGADGVLIFAVDGQELRIADLWPLDPAADSLRLQLDAGVTGAVTRTGKQVVLESDSPRSPLYRQLLGLAPGQTAARLCLPLWGLDSRVVGVLTAHRSPTRPFGQEEIEAADSVTTVLGLRLHVEQLSRTVNRQRSERDRLIEQAISAQEAERRRIAFDLHDGVTTALASMSFHLSSADLALAELSAADDAEVPALTQAHAELVRARQLADLAYNQTRAAISGLHSLVLDDLGLVAAMESLVRAASTGAAAVSMFVDPDIEVEQIPDHVAAAFYRILQEALANAVQHAQATRIVVSLRRVGGSVLLGCVDDGRGFDPVERRSGRATAADGAQHFGLSSIAERCALIEASLRIDSEPGRGTSMLVELAL